MQYGVQKGLFYSMWLFYFSGFIYSSFKYPLYIWIWVMSHPTSLFPSKWRIFLLIANKIFHHKRYKETLLGESCQFGTILFEIGYKRAVGELYFVSQFE